MVSKSEFYQMATVIWVFIGLIAAKQVNGQPTHQFDMVQHLVPVSAMIMALFSGFQAMRERVRAKSQ